MEHTTFLGKTIARDELLAAMERFDRDLRSSFPQKRWVRYAVEHNGQLYPPKQIMRIATGEEVFGGGTQVNVHFERLGFRIINLEGRDEPHGKEEVEIEALETAFSLERDLENSLLANLGQIETGLKLYQDKGVSGRQVDVKEAGRIDILAIDSNGNLVVLELKAGEADDRVCGQIQRYMGWVMDNLAEQRNVRGMIIANSFSDRLRYAVKVVPGLSLKQYQISFKFTDVR